MYVIVFYDRENFTIYKCLGNNYRLFYASKVKIH